MTNIQNTDQQTVLTEKTSSVDRVILGKAEAVKLTKLVDEFNEKVDGLVKVSKADMVNHLISNHAESLTQEEVQSIAIRYYDESRWLGWSLQKLKEAKKRGESLTFEALMQFRNSILSATGQVIKRRRKRTARQAEDFPSAE